MHRLLLVYLFLLISFQEFFCFNYTTKYIEVPVDHFSFSNNETFKLKYLLNVDYWVDDGPIFFYTGNEGNIENFAENTGFVFDIAPQFNALVVFAEHRYYGSSLPFGNLSFSSPEHLGYLTSTQALADFVFVIDQLQKTYKNSDEELVEKLPVIAFGGSYGGMLAAWIRMKYPASVLGSIAASAPIWQFQDLTPCGDFNQIVTSVYRSAIADDCSKPIQRSWSIIRKLLSNGTTDNKEWLSEQWKLCTKITTNEDVDTLINWYQNIIVNMAMVNYPYPTSFLAPLPAYPVRNFCYKLTNTEKMNDTELITAISSALEIYTNFTKSAKCNNINETAPELGEAAWDFQACTEIIMPMCSTDKDMFENFQWNFNDFAEECFKKWGVKQMRPDLPIIEYGGKHIEATSNIVFSNGLLDPWASGGVLTNVSSSVVAVVIPDGAHHLDLRSENQFDPKSVIEARKFHIKNIKKWLNNFYEQGYETFYEKHPYYKKVIVDVE